VRNLGADVVVHAGELIVNLRDQHGLAPFSLLFLIVVELVVAREAALAVEGHWGAGELGHELINAASAVHTSGVSGEADMAPQAPTRRMLTDAVEKGLVIVVEL
jgi:hypothetical protein